MTIGFYSRPSEIDRPQAYSIIDSLSVRYPPGCLRMTGIELQRWLEEIAERPGISRDDKRNAARVAKAVHRLGFTNYAIQ